MSDATIAAMKRAGVPITRENYFQYAFLLSEPSPVDYELEAELPSEILNYFGCDEVQ